MTAAFPQGHPLPGQGTHRRLVAVHLGALLALSLRGVVDLHLGGPLLQALYVVGTDVMLSTSWPLFRPETLGLPTTPGTGLDERQQARVTGAMAASYRVLSLILTLAVFSFVLWSGNLAARLGEAGVGLLPVLMFLILTLPTALLARTEPDADPIGE